MDIKVSYDKRRNIFTNQCMFFFFFIKLTKLGIFAKHIDETTEIERIKYSLIVERVSNRDNGIVMQK